MKLHVSSLLFLVSAFFVGQINSTNVAVVGAGYVGLITATGLSDVGHHVICVDINQKKIDQLNKTEIPFYEPNLAELVQKNIAMGRLSFSSDLQSALQHSEIIIIAVGTPMGNEGRADLSQLNDVVQTIKDNLNGYKIICIKSTVPVGTNRSVEKFLRGCLLKNDSFDCVSNPEFLREGSAIRDFLKNNPIVLGSTSEKALTIMHDLYAPIIEQGNLTVITTTPESAETIKYAWNSYSAMRIAYVNELSQFCNATGADIATVISGMSLSEKLLPGKQLAPGPGFGGSCLPKDTKAFLALADAVGVDFSLIRTVILANKKQQDLILKKLYTMLGGGVEGKTIAVLGLSFKANTDDIRYSPAIPIIQQILRDGGLVKAYDPRAMASMRILIPDVHYCDSVDCAVEDSDVLLLLTEWDEFKKIDLQKIAHLMKNKLCIDTRNLYSPKALEEAGFSFFNVGRRN